LVAPAASAAGGSVDNSMMAQQNVLAVRSIEPSLLFRDRNRFGKDLSMGRKKAEMQRFARLHSLFPPCPFIGHILNLDRHQRFVKLD
jgi:hypothetical protein